MLIDLLPFWIADYLAAWLFLVMTVALMAGFPVTFTMMGVSFLFGLILGSFLNVCIYLSTLYPACLKRFTTFLKHGHSRYLKLITPILFFYNIDYY